MSSATTVSPRRIAANRANASKSTGPKTPDGKAAVAANAVKHGLCATESQRVPKAGAFKSFCESLRAELRPCGVLQEVLFDRIATLAWKLKLVPRAERMIFREDRVARRRRREHDTTMAQLNRQPPPEPPRPGTESIVGLIAREFHSAEPHRNRLATIRRYESSIERSFYKAMNELRELQERDDGLPPSPSTLGEGEDAAATREGDSTEQTQHETESPAPSDGHAAGWEQPTSPDAPPEMRTFLMSDSQPATHDRSTHDKHD